MSKTSLPVVSAPGNSLSSYLETIRKIDILTPVEEQKLALKWHEDGDAQAAQELIMAHLRFVVYIARTYNGYGLPLSDLIQEGNVGLMKAVQRFNPHRGVRLITYAVFWIRAEIHKYILHNWRIVKMASTGSQKKLFFKLPGRRKRLGWMTNDEVQAIAKDLQVQPQEVRDMEARLSYRDTPFDQTSTNDEKEEWTPANYLPDNRQNPALLTEQSDWDEKAQVALNQVMEKLDNKRRFIIQERWLGENKKTLQEVASALGMSHQGVRNIEHKIFQMVRNQIKSSPKNKIEST